MCSNGDITRMQNRLFRHFKILYHSYFVKCPTTPTYNESRLKYNVRENQLKLGGRLPQHFLWLLEGCNAPSGGASCNFTQDGGASPGRAGGAWDLRGRGVDDFVQANLVACLLGLHGAAMCEFNRPRFRLGRNCHRSAVILRVRG